MVLSLFLLVVFRFVLLPLWVWALGRGPCLFWDGGEEGGLVWIGVLCVFYWIVVEEAGLDLCSFR